MADARRDEDTIDDLIAALEEAPAGGPELDRMVAFQLGLPMGESDEMIKLLLFEGYGWDVISELVQSEDPSFSTALDACIPGENIVLAMRSAKRRQWAAIHRGNCGRQFVAWAATEPLARRAAALRGLRAVSAFNGPAQPDTDTPPATAASGEGPAQGTAETERGMSQQDMPPATSDETPPEEWKILF